MGGGGGGGGGQDLKKEDAVGSSMDSAVWLDVGDCVFGKEMGSLQSCLIGKWKKNPNPYPAVEEMEVWFKDAWRLNEEVTVSVLNVDLLMRCGCSMDSAVWLDVGDCVFGKEMGSLQSCLIGKWKKNPNPYPAVEEMEVWFKDAWRLNEEVTVSVLNVDLLMLKFDSLEKAKWVLEMGRRSFNRGVLQLEWWRPETGCVRSKDTIQEVWIRVVGLPLHLWKPEILRKLGDVCGGFVI